MIAIANDSIAVGRAGRVAFLSAIGVTTYSYESVTSLSGTVRPPAECVAVVPAVGVGVVRPPVGHIAGVPSSGVALNSISSEKPTSDAVSVAGAVVVPSEQAVAPRGILRCWSIGVATVGPEPAARWVWICLLRSASRREPDPCERRCIRCSPGCGGGGGRVVAAMAGSTPESREGDVVVSDILFSNQVTW
jgi:hypothetical protein